MMMEQQKALKNDEMQDRWKRIVFQVCREYSYRKTVEAWESLREALETFSEKVKECFDSLSYYAEEIREVFEDDRKSYPHSYPQHVHNYKVNTKGFPRPISRCARSRCK